MRRALPLLACLLISAGLQTVIFPVAGPLPVWRAQFAWIALVPWFYVIFLVAGRQHRPILGATLWSYLCGVLWYMGHCYWIFATMHLYGGLSSPMAALVLLLFCLYLGLYHACFGAVAAMLWRYFHRRLPLAVLAALIALAWVAVELARARVTSFPWNLLGYSQIDNAALTLLVPIAGVYAISFVLALVNAGFAVALLQRASAPRSGHAPSVRAGVTSRLLAPALALVVAVSCMVAGAWYKAPRPTPDAQATAVQPNLSPAPDGTGPVALEQQLAQLSTQAQQRAGTPAPKLILWPEAPTPFELHERLLQATLTTLATRNNATVLADSNAVDSNPSHPRQPKIYNAVGLFTAQGLHGRYDKIHLVPFGEFMPYASLFSFASGLTQQVGLFDRGTRRVPLTDGQHRYGVFICYESIFPDEVRQLVREGADVLVNLSDDGWYGDTSAPFQHSNMARMRAIENRRWLVRDTNTGITESIDPYGNIRAIAPRHQRLATVLPYAYATGLTTYTLHGDVFAWSCAALTAGALVLSVVSSRRLR